MNISVFLNNLGANQAAYSTITQLNNLYNTKQDVDITVFYNDLQRFCIQPHFGVMHAVEAWDQEGIGIATSFNTVEKLLGCPRLNPKIYYMWDLEFLRMNPKRYDVCRNIICHPKIELVVRSQSHQYLVENNFNRQVNGIIDNFNIEELLWHTDIKHK